MRNIIILAILLFSLSLHAQTPPEACARMLIGLGQDSITWQATPCASFGGYVVLGQQNGTGNFVALDTVTTAAYVQPNPTEAAWNYQVGMLCNGLLTNLSNTISNQRPVTPDLRSVNIVNNTPVVSWDASPSTAVIGYQLYKENPYNSGNFFPYPNANSIVFGTSYTDNASADLLVRYALVAVSDCNKGLLGIGSALDGTTGPHTSMVVAGSIDSCSQTINLSWNAYENWEDGTQKYEIWLSTNGSVSAVLDTVPSSTLNYTYRNAQDNDILVFQIRAVEANKNNVAFTNTLRFDVRVNRPMDFIHLTDISVQLNNEIKVAWTWDTDVDFASGSLDRGNDSLLLNSRLALPVIGSAQNSFTDNNAVPEESNYYYQVQSTDACGQVVRSNIGRTILLEITAEEGYENHIHWSAAYLQYGEVQDYWLYKEGNRIATLSATDTQYIDQLDVRNEQEVFSCYWVIANIKMTFPDGTIRYTQNQSNQACATQGSSLQIPNAIAVNGINNQFRPLVIFGRSINSYTMKIFDRYGGQVFESNDLYDAWDGTYDGQPLRQGVYIYLIRYQAPDGTPIERKGTVMLIK